MWIILGSGYRPIDVELTDGQFRAKVSKQINDQADAAANAVRKLPGKDELEAIKTLAERDIPASEMMKRLISISAQGDDRCTRADRYKRWREAWFRVIVERIAEQVAKMFDNLEDQLDAGRDEEMAWNALLRDWEEPSDPLGILCKIVAEIDAQKKAEAEADGEGEEPDVVAGPSS